MTVHEDYIGTFIEIDFDMREEKIMKMMSHENLLFKTSEYSFYIASIFQKFISLSYQIKFLRNYHVTN